MQPIEVDIENGSIINQSEESNFYTSTIKFHILKKQDVIIQVSKSGIKLHYIPSKIQLNLESKKNLDIQRVE